MTARKTADQNPAHAASDPAEDGPRNGFANGEVQDGGLFYQSHASCADVVPTGERYVPDVDVLNSYTAYEHWHRYLYASAYVAGKTVLDVASGEGYGSHYLAQVAKHVVGVDASMEAVQHASSNYPRWNLDFRCGLAEALPLEGAHIFDVVVSFETIEHIGAAQQQRFLTEIRRVLKPEGILLLSTPNKLLFSDKPNYRNEFHVKEFYCKEYLELLRRSFCHVHLLGQKVYPVSYLWPLTGHTPRVVEHQLAYAAGQFGPVAGDKKAVYILLAVCSNHDIELPAASVLLDVSERQFRAPGEALAQKDKALESLAAQLAAKDQAIQGLTLMEENNSRRALAVLRQTIEEHARELCQRDEAGRHQVAAQEQQVQELTRQVAAGQQEAAALRQTIEHLRQTVEQKNRDLTQENEAGRRVADELSRQVQELIAGKVASERETGVMRQRVQELTAEMEAARREAASLHDTIEQKNRDLVQENAAGRRVADELGLQVQELSAAKAAGERETAVARQRVEELAAQVESGQREAAASDREAGELCRQIQELTLLAEATQRDAAALRQTVERQDLELAQTRANAGRESEALRQQLRQLEGADGEAATLRQRVQELTLRVDASQRDAAALAQADGAQKEQVAYLTARLDQMGAREKELRELLLDAHDQLLRRDEEIKIALATALQHNPPVVTGRPSPAPAPPASTSTNGSAPSDYLRYQLMIHQLRELVRQFLPADATVLVVNKGDTDLLQLDGRKAWHFPQQEDGQYAGHNPADSAAAIDHLEALRAKGATFLVFPNTTQWWLEHYAEFREHLETRYQVLAAQEGVGVIFALRQATAEKQEAKPEVSAPAPVVSETPKPGPPAPASKAQLYQELVQRIRGVVRSTLPLDASVVVISKGDNELLNLEGRRAWHYPQQDDGAYAGHYPADSAAAITHLEALRAKGANFLLVPHAFRWWLEHYAEFKHHLESNYRCVHKDDSCVIYALSRAGRLGRFWRRLVRTGSGAG